MAEARLPTGQKWVFVEDTGDTLGWMPVVQIDSGFTMVSGTVAVLEPITVEGHVSVTGTVVSIVNPVTIAEPVTVDGSVSVLGVVPVDGWVHVTGTVSVAEPVTVDGHVSVTGTIVSIVNPVTIAEPVTVDGFVSITGSVSEIWRVALTQDEAADDSDKIFTVPASQEWQILWIWAEFSTFTGTAANPSRQLEIQLQDSAGDVIGAWHPSITQSNATAYNYMFAPALPDLLALRDSSYLMTPLPPTIFLSAGQKIRIWDNNAVDASNDDLNVQMQYAWRSV